MKVGIIGNGFHSKRIQNILKKKKINFFLYKPDKPKYYNTKDFDKLKKCKIIFIISPNNTHFSYIKKLHKKRYIFCEKPPVSSISELKKLEKIKSNKIYFNYNFRFLKISEILENQKKFNLGKLINANLVSSHGLALKKEYKNSWRSNIKKCKKGVYEIVSIHWIDLINYHFAIKKISLPKLLNFSRIGSSFDTSSVEIILQNDSIVNIFSTYNSAYAKRLFFLFQNGIIEQIDNILTIKGPAINLDKKGFFKKPKLIKSFNIPEVKDYNLSLDKSVSFFIKIAKSKKNFNKNLFNLSLNSNKLVV
jgi:predicted dehydrogenase